MYSVKAVSQATGISPETLRAWERRYSAVTPDRERNGRRSYSPDDLTRLRTLKRLSDLGHPIGKLATLDDDALHDLLRAAMETDPSGQAAGCLVDKLVQAARDYDEAQCDEMLGLAVASLAPDRLVGDVLGPALRRIGDLWQRGEATVAQEHLLSSRVRRLVLSVMNAYRSVQHGPTVVFATLDNERHNIGSMLAAYLATAAGSRGLYIESSMPAVEIIAYADAVDASAVAIGMVMQPTDVGALDSLRRLADNAGERREIWIGGPAADELERNGNVPEGVTYIPAVTEVAGRLPALSD